MQLSVGDIVEGKVTGITVYGAFVDIGEGKTGMVHISEVSNVYVSDIREVLKEGQQVKVKVLSIDEKGKISLSIKRTMEQPKRDSRRPQRSQQSSPAPRAQSSEPSTYEWQPRKSENLSFEDMMSRFKQASDEKMTVLKKNSDNRRSSFPKKNSGK